MPSIYYDPTESNTRSRLPDDVIASGTPLPGLEHYTAADILITNLSEPKLDRVTDAVPHQLALRKLILNGLLVQRKTTDLCSSIPALKEILGKMQSWHPKYGSWLLFIGELIQSNKTGEAVIDGRLMGWKYKAVRVSLLKWQMRGGYYDNLRFDNLVGSWIGNWLTIMGNIEQEPETLVDLRKPQQVIVSMSDDPGLRRPWRNTLATFPGIGLAKATAIADYCGSLWESLLFLSSHEHLILPDRPKGIGTNNISDAIRWLGLPLGTILAPLPLRSIKFENGKFVLLEEMEFGWKEQQESQPEEPKDSIDDESELKPPWSA